MMNIDKSNFEAFFLDYYEGNLSPHQEESLMAFLDSEPELRAVFEEFEMIKCSDSGSVSCSFKDRLKRGVITGHNFEWYFAAYLEGDLDLEERKMVEAFASASPSMRQELDHM
ncbi:MAG TPA: hypothetical protein VLH61_07205, partial [Bacteroidales bacterium]|nr:hypothetical protein [Bacteroidales bacterium]